MDFPSRFDYPAAYVREMQNSQILISSLYFKSGQQWHRVNAINLYNAINEKKINLKKKKWKHYKSYFKLPTLQFTKTMNGAIKNKEIKAGGEGDFHQIRLIKQVNWKQSMKNWKPRHKTITKIVLWQRADSG